MSFLEVLSGINAMIAMSSPKTNEITPKNLEISKKVMMPRIMNVTPPMNPPNGSTGSSVFFVVIVIVIVCCCVANCVPLWRKFWWIHKIFLLYGNLYCIVYVFFVCQIFRSKICLGLRCDIRLKRSLLQLIRFRSN